MVGEKNINGSGQPITHIIDRIIKPSRSKEDFWEGNKHEKSILYPR